MGPQGASAVTTIQSQGSARPNPVPFRVGGNTDTVKTVLRAPGAAFGLLNHTTLGYLGYRGPRIVLMR